MVSKDNIQKEVWQGIRKMKKSYQPLPSELWMDGEKTATTKGKAEAAANFLEQKIWNNKSTELDDSEPDREK